MKPEEQMNIVIVGHVDHGKSTVIGRLLADTHSLPDGKLESIKEKCKRESKVFEYAFLLDALKDEQNQGITIDSARCFFNSSKRNYIIIDAPGHIEFLKNMISGAARAEAAILVIDAKEGLRENSFRHGYMLSMLGIRQVIVCVNKMDLVGYDQKIFNQIKTDFEKFLNSIKIQPKEFIPVSALEGDNIVNNTARLKWFQGNNILDALDTFHKEADLADKPFRMPVQDVYKFTSSGDDRRLIAGRIESGGIDVDDEVIFLPSGKQSKIKSIEQFDVSDINSKSAGECVSVILTEQIYVNRGEIMCKLSEALPYVSSFFSANIFWMGRNPLSSKRDYKLKLGTKSVQVKVKEIKNVLNASNLNKRKDQEIQRHEVAECVFECLSPIAYDLYENCESTGRFVIVDNYDIAGGGIITEYIQDRQKDIRDNVFLREKRWEHGDVSFKDRAIRFGQLPKLILITGPTGVDKKTIAKKLEKYLFNQGRNVYFLGIGNLLRGLDSDIDKEKRAEHIRRLGEVAHILMDAGMIVVATASDLNDEEVNLLQTITFRDELLLISIQSKDISFDKVDLLLEYEGQLDELLSFLKFKGIIFDF